VTEAKKIFHALNEEICGGVEVGSVLAGNIPAKQTIQKNVKAKPTDNEPINFIYIS
jgi:hypothetical protein